LQAKGFGCVRSDSAGVLTPALTLIESRRTSRRWNLARPWPLRGCRSWAPGRRRPHRGHGVHGHRFGRDGLDLGASSKL